MEKKLLPNASMPLVGHRRSAMSHCQMSADAWRTQAAAVCMPSATARSDPHCSSVRFVCLPQVMMQMAVHPLTDKGLQAFVDDWEKVKAQQKNTL